MTPFADNHLIATVEMYNAWMFMTAWNHLHPHSPGYGPGPMTWNEKRQTLIATIDRYGMNANGFGMGTESCQVVLHCFPTPHSVPYWDYVKDEKHVFNYTTTTEFTIEDVQPKENNEAASDSANDVEDDELGDDNAYYPADEDFWWEEASVIVKEVVEFIRKCKWSFSVEGTTRSWTLSHPPSKTYLGSWTSEMDWNAPWTEEVPTN